MAVVLGVVALWPTWGGYLPEISRDPAYRVTAEGIEIPPHPEFMPGGLRRDIVAKVGDGKPLSLLDETLLPRLREAFARRAWVKRVGTLRKMVPGRIVAELEYRRAVAMVETDDDPRLVAADGRLLPGEAGGLPRILGTDTEDNPASRGAAAIADLLLPEWSTMGIERIRAASGRSESSKAVYLLEADGGSRVIWGHAPGAGPRGEATALEKLGRLREYVASRGRLDGSRPAVEIDLRSWRGLAVRRLPAGGSAAVTSR